MHKDSDRPKGKHFRLAIFGATVALAALGAVPAAWSDSSWASAKPPPKPVLKVAARIRAILGSGQLTPIQVFFTPNVISAGTVLIVVRNYDPLVAHQLSINGVQSKWMGPGSGTAVMKVTFKRPGKYSAQAYGGIDDGESGGFGLLKVLK